MLRRHLHSLLLIVCGFSCGCVGTRHASGPLVTKNHIRAIQVDMSRTEVDQLLGPPLSCDVYRDDQTLTYTRWPIGAHYYPMLWVHMTGDRVRSVYVKRYGATWLDDDIGVYGRGVVDFERPEFEALFPD